MGKIIGGQKGTSLLSIVTSMSILSSMTLTMAHTLQMGTKGALKVAQNLEISALRAEIQTTIFHSQLCHEALKDGFSANVKISNPSSEDPTNIDSVGKFVNSVYTPTAKEGQLLPHGLRVQDIRLTYMTADDGTALAPMTDTPSQGLTTHFMVLSVYIESSDSLKTLRPIPVELITEDAGANKMHSCGQFNLQQNHAQEIQFHWALDVDGCPSGFESTEIRDDHDHHHKLGKSGGTPIQTMCVSGVNSTLWTDTQCPAGFLDTTLTDNGAPFDISSGGGLSEKYRFCVEGATEAKWSPDCPPGWAETQIYDEGLDAVHSLSKSSNGSRWLQLCIR